MLAGEQGLAHVSLTPGFTKLINIFTMNKTWRLVDLPGYGFAQVARKDSARFNTAVLEYLEHRTNLCLVFALIDSVLPPQAIDVEFVEWLVGKAAPFVLVFTKTDKVSGETAQANIAASWSGLLPGSRSRRRSFTCSAEKGQGRQELLGVIDEAMTAIKAESNKPRLLPKTRQPQGRRRGCRKSAAAP